MATPYSFSDSLKSLVSPFSNLFKKQTTPSPSIFTPASAVPKVGLNAQTMQSFYKPMPSQTPAVPKVGTSVAPIPTVGSLVTNPQPQKPLAPTQSAFTSTPPVPNLYSTPSGAQVNAQGQLVTPPPAISSPTIPQTSQDSAQGSAKTPTMPQVSPEVQKSIDSANRAYEESLKISPEELSTQEDLDKLIESTKTAYRNTSGQAIPLEFITGQLKSIEERATGLAEPLERKLARLQAVRQSSLEASKFALERADKKAEQELLAKKPVSGTSFYDPTTGEFKQAPSATETKAPTTIETSEGIKQWNPSTGSWESTGMSKPPSATTEAKAAEKTEKEQASQQSASNSLQIVNNLLTDNNWKAISGAIQTASIPWFGKPEVANQYTQLKSMLALGARSLLKGSGAVSDYEAKVLQDSTSSLGRNLGEAEMEKALRTVRGVLKTNQGLETEVIVKDPNGNVIGQGLLNGQDVYDAVRDGNIIEYL